MAAFDPPTAPESASPLTRREFVKAAGLAAVAAVSPLAVAGRAPAAPSAGPSPSAAAETAVARFHASLKDAQRKIICFPFDHPLRSKVQNNWAIVKPTIGDLDGEQKALCREIFKNLLSEEGYERFQKQMDDDYGGFESYHVAVFGEPGTEKPFEWVLTGRHDTLRADGNSVDGRGLRRADLLRPRRHRQRQRRRQAHQQRLVVSGQAGQQDLRHPRRQAEGPGPRRQGRARRAPRP